MKKLVVCAALVAMSCGGNSKEVRPSGGDESPDWVSQGNGEVTTEAGKRLQGIGSATGEDPKTRRQAADQAAKTKMENELGALTASLSRMSESTMENLPDTIAAMVKKAAAQSAAIRDHWVQQDGNELSFESMDLAAFKSALGSIDGDDRLKKELQDNSEKAFDALNANRGQ